MNGRARPDPYCAFTSDRDRLWAPVARNVRDIAIVALVVWAGPPISAGLWAVLRALSQ
jgi:hypothetical protein